MMQRYKQPHFDVHPDGEWIRYEDHVEAMKRIAGDRAQGLTASQVAMLHALLVSIRPEYGTPGSRDVDVGRQQKRIDAALAILAQAAPSASAQQAPDAAIAELRAVERWISKDLPIPTTGATAMLIRLGKAIDAIAAPSASARQAEPEKVSRRVHLSAAQLLEALEFVAPDRDTDQDQLDGEVTIEHGEGHSGTGYYCYVSDYPEEGAILLDGESASSILAAPAPASPAAPNPACSVFEDMLQTLEYTEAVYRLNVVKDSGEPSSTLENLQRVIARAKSPSPAALTDEPGLLEYVLQDDLHNRTTPRVIDIAYTAFMAAKQPNTEDGGPSDWFTDTRPVVLAAIEKLRKDLLAASPADQVDARGASIKATWWHDGGAYARCSYCGRYSDNPKSLSRDNFPCDCGHLHGWSGSFKKPAADAKWSEADLMPGAMSASKEGA